MRKRLNWLISILALAALSLVFVVGVNAAKPTPKAKKTFSLPEHAKQVAPGVFYLGKALHQEKIVEGYAYVDYKKGYGKPGAECGDGVCEPGENAKKCPQDCGGGNGEESTCYGFLARGAKWKSLEDWRVNPENSRDLGANFIFSNLASNIGKWESAAAYEILGEGTKTTDILEADTVEPDDQNEIYFADIANSNAIAVTIVWGYFSGNPSWRELIEWDQIYDDVTFDWSEDCLSENCETKMDFENIATHELGHSVGMDDLYVNNCSEETMYGYATFGETKKRDLGAGDITGIRELY